MALGAAAAELPELPLALGSVALRRALGLVVAVGALLGLAGRRGCVGDGLAVAGGVTDWTSYTARKRSCAVCPTSRTSSSCWTFGTLTTIWSLPEVVTSDSPTPRLSTRLWMIVLASWRLVGSTWPVPLVFLAVSVIVVPPCRSRPSFGVQVPLSAISAVEGGDDGARMIRVRPGCPEGVATGGSYSLVEGSFPGVWVRPGVTSLAVGPRSSQPVVAGPVRADRRRVAVGSAEVQRRRRVRIVVQVARLILASAGPSSSLRPDDPGDGRLQQREVHPGEISTTICFSPTETTVPNRPLPVITRAPGSIELHRLLLCCCRFFCGRRIKK